VRKFLGIGRLAEHGSFDDAKIRLSMRSKVRGFGGTAERSMH